MDYKSLPKERNCILPFGAKIPGITVIALWYSQLLSNTSQNQRVRSDFYLQQPRLPLVNNGGLVAIGTDLNNILQRVGGHWSPLIQIATDVGSRWEKSEFRLFLNLQSFGAGFLSRLFPFDPGKYKYPNTVTYQQAQASAGRNSNLPCGARGKIGHQVNRCVIFWKKTFN